MTVLSWLAPPIVGAGIGFLTNDIAIRMLFRPLREYRFLGIRVPFTPGIIPRRRRELAEAIGRMVAEELVTADTIIAHLRRESVRESIRAWVARSTERALRKPLGDLAGAGPGDAGTPSLALELLEGFLASDELPALVGAAVSSALGSLETASVDSLAGGADPARSVARAVVGLVPGGGRLIWSEQSIEAAAALVRVAAAPAAKALGGALGAPELRSEIERRARDLLRSALEKLSVLQRFFVRAGQYDRRLDEKLPEIVDDALRQAEGLLGEEAGREALAGAVRAALESRAEGGRPPEQTGSAVREALVDLVASLLRPLFARPLRRSVEGLLGTSAEDLEASVTRRVVAVARAPGAARALLATASRAASSQAGRDLTLGALLGIDAEAKERLDRSLCDRAVELLEARLPELIAGFDLRAMVVRRIDALDVADVERLLMMVIARHLKWINVFGALLGALIGLAQVLLNALA